MVRRLLVSLAVLGIVVGPAVSSAGIIIIVNKEGRPVPIEVAAAGEVKLAGALAAPAALAPKPIVPAPAIDPMILKQIEAGEITAEEAEAGCGGNASGGAASAVPLLVAGLVLLRVRRRS